MDGFADRKLPLRQIALVFGGGLLLTLLLLTGRFYLPVSLIKLSIAGLIAMAAAFTFFAYPKTGLLAAIFYIYGGLGYILQYSLSYVIILVVATGTLMKLARGERIRLRDPFFVGSVVVFTLISVQSIVFARSYGLSAYALGQWAKALMMLFLIVQLVETPRDLERVAVAALAGTMASIAIGVTLILTGHWEDISFRPVAGLIRFQGTHDNSNNAALYFTTVIPLGAYLIKRAPSLLMRLLATAATLVTFLAVIATLSRQAVFPLSVVVLGVFFREAHSRKAYIAAGVFVFAAIVATPSFYWHRIASISDAFSGETTHDFSFYMRMNALKTAWELFREYPLTGVGLNNFPLRSGYQLFVRIPAHNAYLDVLVGVGLVGLASFLVMHAAVLRAARRAVGAWREAADDRASDLAHYFMLAYLAGMVGAVFQSVPYYYLIWVPAAAGLAAHSLFERSTAGKKS